jgi:hypothetical protein
MNVYNNLFSTTGSRPIEPHNDGYATNDMTGACQTSTNFLVRIYNNTFYETGQWHIEPWAQNCYAYYVWRPALNTNLQLDVKNNLFYDTTTNSQMLSFWVTNTAVYAGFSFDYNCYRSLSEQFVYQETSSGYSNTDLGGLRSYGWEIHGITNPATVFVDATSTSYSITNNYQLHSGSPCIGAGVNLSAVGLPGLNADITGKLRPSGAWDLGAYQH